MNTEDQYQFDSHSFGILSKRLNFQVCLKCGLVLLNNAATRKAVKLGCDYRIHPSILNEKRMR